MKKTVLMTGATKGIGLATSQRLANKGYQIIGIARQGGENFPGILFTCDLGDGEQTDNVLQKIVAEYTIDHIVNNVGMVVRQVLGNIDLCTLQQIYELNVRATVQVTQAFIEQMKAKRSGKIINLSSRAIIGLKELSAYSAAKSAILGLTKSWTLELAPFNITVNAIAPGPIDTELLRRAFPAGSEKEKKLLVDIPETVQDASF